MALHKPYKAGMYRAHTPVQIVTMQFLEVSLQMNPCQWAFGLQAGQLEGDFQILLSCKLMPTQ